MKRPFMSIMRYNLVKFIGIGSCWALEALLELFEQTPLITGIQISAYVVMILLFLYAVVCEQEEGDEMSEASQNEPYAFGLHILFIIALSYLLLDSFFGITVQLRFAVFFLLGAGYLTIGTIFFLRERMGNI